MGVFGFAGRSRTTIHTGSGADTGSNLCWDAGNYIWNNSGDTATLKNAASTTVDSCRYSGAGSSTAC